MRTTRSLILLALGLASALVVPLFASSPAPADKPLDVLVKGLESSLKAKDRPGYVGLFVPELAAQEGDFYDDVMGRQGMETVSIQRSSSSVPSDLSAPVYLQVFFENSYFALEEAWRVSVVLSEGRWLVSQKQIMGDVNGLYKISIPSGRQERVDRIEIDHQDIKISFTEASVFYDNLPDIDTALIVLGKGRLEFEPSVEAERHQLELSCGKPRLSENLESLYVRCSGSFFKDHIRTTKSSGRQSGAVTQAEARQAYSIFARNYERSGTVENPATGQLYSVLPQSDEAVFELRTTGGREYTYINSPFVPEEVHFLDRTEERLINLYSPEDKAGGRRMLLSFGRPFDIQRCDLDADYTPESHYFSVKAKLEIMSRSDHLGSLKLVLNPAFEIVHLYDGAGRELFFTQDRLRNLVYVHLIEPVQRGASFSLEFYYRGQLEPPESTTDVLAFAQEGRRSLYQRTDGALIPGKFETYFYTSSSHWYPSTQDEDYFTARMRIIVPPEYECVASGTLLGREPLNNVRNVEAIEKVGRMITTFETRQPVKYLSFVVGRMSRGESGADPKGTFFQTNSIYLRTGPTWEMCREVLSYYRDYLGAFPFEKLDVVQRLWPNGGGSSPAAFIVLNEIPRSVDTRVVLNPRSPVDFSRWKEYFVAHEIAHQWWGQAVSWNTYHDQWLSEGLAQFTSLLFLEQKYGDKAALAIRKKLCQWTGRDSRWGAITLGSRLSLLNFEAYQAVIYDKAALVLFMLRDIVGPEVFRAGLRDFYESSRYQAVRTGQFFKSLAKVSGRDLDPFVRCWFDSYALPEVRLTWSAVEIGGGNRLRLKVEQSGEPFVYPLTLEWKEKGRAVRRTIFVDEATHDLDLETGARPEKLTADPDGVFPGTVDVRR